MLKITVNDRGIKQMNACVPKMQSDHSRKARATRDIGRFNTLIAGDFKRLFSVQVKSGGQKQNK